MIRANSWTSKGASLIVSLALMIGMTSVCLAEGKYFDGRLTLPDFPNYEVFVQTVTSQKAATLKNGERWSLTHKPNKGSKQFLLVAPKKNLWVTLSLLHTPYGDKKPLPLAKFEVEFMSRMATAEATLAEKKTLKSTQAGEVGYYYFKHKKGQFATRALYIPADRLPDPADPKKNVRYFGDKRAFLISITHTPASAGQAKKLLGELLDQMKVEQKP